VVFTANTLIVLLLLSLLLSTKMIKVA